MCEIAILDPRRNSTEILTQAALDVYDRMNSSLGLVTIHDPETKPTFDFDIYKAVTPEREGVSEFMHSAKDAEDAVRVIIHGRLATQGDITEEHAHPLEIDCSECDVDYVLHNGIVRQFEYQRDEHKDNDHNYTTNVDSEVIAHEFGDVPDGFGNAIMEIADTQPAVVLLNEHRMFVRGNHYHLAEDGRMSRSNRDFGPRSHEDNYEAVIMNATEPEKEVPHA